MLDAVSQLHDVCAVDELSPGQTKIIEVNGRSIGVFNVKGTFYAMNNLCPHAGAPLCLGRVTGTPVADNPYSVSWDREGEIVRCPWHSWEFDIATGKTLAGPRKSVRTYAVHQENGRLYIDLRGAR
ncbi:3-phenylpropionate dioxygenase ferredoxin subunit OS=Afipia felis OX=1035 GN=NCTC12722_03859 PE=4 SV=1 [Afipia felis]